MNWFGYYYVHDGNFERLSFELLSQLFQVTLYVWEDQTKIPIRNPALSSDLSLRTLFHIACRFRDDRFIVNATANQLWCDCWKVSTRCSVQSQTDGLQENIHFKYYPLTNKRCLMFRSYDNNIENRRQCSQTLLPVWTLRTGVKCACSQSNCSRWYTSDSFKLVTTTELYFCWSSVVRGVYRSMRACTVQPPSGFIIFWYVWSGHRKIDLCFHIIFFYLHNVKARIIITIEKCWIQYGSKGYFSTTFSNVITDHFIWSKIEQTILKIFTTFYMLQLI